MAFTSGFRSEQLPSEFTQENMDAVYLRVEHMLNTVEKIQALKDSIPLSVTNPVHVSMVQDQLNHLDPHGFQSFRMEGTEMTAQSLHLRMEGIGSSILKTILKFTDWLSDCFDALIKRLFSSEVKAAVKENPPTEVIKEALKESKENFDLEIKSLYGAEAFFGFDSLDAMRKRAEEFRKNLVEFNRSSKGLEYCIELYLNVKEPKPEDQAKFLDSLKTAGSKILSESQPEKGVSLRLIMTAEQSRDIVVTGDSVTVNVVKTELQKAESFKLTMSSVPSVTAIFDPFLVAFKSSADRMINDAEANNKRVESVLKSVLGQNLANKERLPIIRTCFALHKELSTSLMNHFKAEGTIIKAFMSFSEKVQSAAGSKKSSESK